MPQPEQRRSPAETQALAEKVWAMYLAGHPQRLIATGLGISQQYVSHLLKQVRDQIPKESREELVQAADERYGKLRAAYMDAALDDGDIDAAKLVLQIENDRRKMLGLDAVTKIEQDATVRYQIRGLVDDDE